MSSSLSAQSASQKSTIFTLVIFRILNIIIKCPIHITNDSFRYSQMGLLSIGLISSTNSNTVTNVKVTGYEVKKTTNHTFVQYWITSRPFSSFVNLTFVPMGVLKYLVVFNPNFFTNFLVYLLWDIMIPFFFSCFTCKPRKYVS